MLGRLSTCWGQRLCLSYHGWLPYGATSVPGARPSNSGRVLFLASSERFVEVIHEFATLAECRSQLPVCFHQPQESCVHGLLRGEGPKKGRPGFEPPFACAPLTGQLRAPSYNHLT
jgi:hypothetical protein